MTLITQVRLNRNFAVAFLWLTCTAGAFAQGEAEGQLTDKSDAINYFAGQERSAWRGNSEKLAVIDKAYSDAIAALSAENAERNKAIFAENSAAHKALAEKGLQGDERVAEFNRIQAETNKAREELRAWHDTERRAITEKHTLDRAAQMAATQELIARLGEQRVATLQRLLDGPVNLTSLPPLTPVDESGATGDAETTSGVIEDSSQGPATGGGGIDLGGTVDIDTPGDELVANANPDRRRLIERLFQEEVERRRRAEEEAASQLNFIQTTQAQAHTTASASSRRRQPNCEDYPYGDGPDADGDGVVDYRCGGSDCDDSNPNRYPGNTEVGDAGHVDEDCDPSTFGNVDRDGDGYYSAMNCNSDGSTLNCGNDCDDSKASVHPTASEVCNHIDDNCNANVDEGVTATKYLDRDGDLHGDPDESLLVCAQTGSHTDGHGTFNWLSAVGNDCDDSDPAIWQGCSQ